MNRSEFDAFVSTHPVLQELLAVLSGTTSSTSASSVQQPAFAPPASNPQTNQLTKDEISAFFAYCDKDSNGRIDKQEALNVLGMLSINPETGDDTRYSGIDYIQRHLNRFRSFTFGCFSEMVKTWHEKLVIDIKELIIAQAPYVKDGWVSYHTPNGALAWQNTKNLTTQYKHPGYKKFIGIPSKIPISISTADSSAAGHFKVANTNGLRLVYLGRNNQVQPFVKKIFELPASTELGVGRDLSPHSLWNQANTPSSVKRSLKVKHIWRIENRFLWLKYSMEAEEVKEDFKKLNAARITTAEVRTMIEANVGPLGNDVLDDDINEKWLLHGTKFEFVRSIMEKGLNERYANLHGYFGAGNYFGDTPEKTDQYTPPHELSQVEDQILLDTLFPGGRQSSDYLHYALLCRVILGAPQEQHVACQAARECDVLHDTIKYHSIHAIPGHAVKRHHEYVQFHGERIYPAYLIAYERHFNDAFAKV